MPREIKLVSSGCQSCPLTYERQAGYDGYDKYCVLTDSEVTPRLSKLAFNGDCPMQEVKGEG